MRFVADLAEFGTESFVSLSESAARTDVSKKYLERIAAMLRKGGLVETGRGKAGGYRLASAPESITVGRVLRLTEGDLCPVMCMMSNPNRCPRSGFCKSLALWRGLSRTMVDYLDGITLADMMAGRV